MTDPNNTQPPQTELPDTGNHMSDRAGDYTESGGAPMPGHTLDGQELPQDTLDSDGSGTTFDGGSAIPGSNF